MIYTLIYKCVERNELNNLQENSLNSFYNNLIGLIESNNREVEDFANAKIKELKALFDRKNNEIKVLVDNFIQINNDKIQNSCEQKKDSKTLLQKKRIFDEKDNYNLFNDSINNNNCSIALKDDYDINNNDDFDPLFKKNDDFDSLFKILDNMLKKKTTGKTKLKSGIRKEFKIMCSSKKNTAEKISNLKTILKESSTQALINSGINTTIMKEFINFFETQNDQETIENLRQIENNIRNEYKNRSLSAITKDKNTNNEINKILLILSKEKDKLKAFRKNKNLIQNLLSSMKENLSTRCTLKPTIKLKELLESIKENNTKPIPKTEEGLLKETIAQLRTETFKTKKRNITQYERTKNKFKKT